MTMYTILTFLTICVVYNRAISYELLIQEQWENFKIQHEKTYNSETEEHYRRSIYMDNLHKINEHNKLYEMGLSSYKMGMNDFGDLPEDEFMGIYNMTASHLVDEGGYPTKSTDGFYIYAPLSDKNVTNLPQSIDWRAKGAVTRVKNQGRCGSCWSFSATGVIEGQWYKKTRKLVSLSEQNIMDCSRRYYNKGCKGGLPLRALRYIMDNGGINAESSYPYRAVDTSKCKYKPKGGIVSVKNIVLVPNREIELQRKVSSVGPMAGSIVLNHNFQFYHSGIFNDRRCGMFLGHSVLVVGYGFQKRHEYWLVKNSWGIRWGEKGYVRMTRNKGNQCGIASRIVYPLV